MYPKIRAAINELTSSKLRQIKTLDKVLCLSYYFLEQNVWAPPFGRRTFARWQMGEQKPWHRAINFLFHRFFTDQFISNFEINVYLLNHNKLSCSLS